MNYIYNEFTIIITMNEFYIYNESHGSDLLTHSLKKDGKILSFLLEFLFIFLKTSFILK